MLAIFIFLLVISCSLCAIFLDIDMKKDIEVLIAEERAEIISKYNKVNYTIYPLHLHFVQIYILK